MKRLLRITKKIFIALFALIALVSVISYFYMKQDKFGRTPTGARLERIKKSPNYKDGKFRNRTERPTLTKGYSMAGLAYKALFKKFDRTEPTDTLPSVKTNLHALPIDTNLVVWFGHSSMYMQLDGKRYLIDPVFSGAASPIPGMVKAYKGSNVYQPEDIPEVDYLLISHDHYDHLDYSTIVALKSKVKKVICGLGVGAHFEYWGYSEQQIEEMDWYETFKIADNYLIHIMPTHHDGGRAIKRAQSLWISFVIESPSLKIFYSGDGGYDAIFKEIGEKFGPIDFAMIECGQYNVAWQSVHKLPEEVKQATIDIKAKRMMPVHHSKFTLGQHSWDEPLIKMTEMAQNAPYRLATPMIGEVVYLNQPEQKFSKWWVGIN